MVVEASADLRSTIYDLQSAICDLRSAAHDLRSMDSLNMIRIGVRLWLFVAQTWERVC